MRGKTLRIGTFRKSSKFSHSPDHVRMIINSKHEELETGGDLSTWTAHVRHALADPTCDGMWITWQELSPSEIKLVTKRLAKFIHSASGYRKHCHVGNSASECRDVDFAGDLKDSKSTFWPHIRGEKLDLHEANSCVTQQHRSRNCTTHWSESRRNSCAQFVGRGN